MIEKIKNLIKKTFLKDIYIHIKYKLIPSKIYIKIKFRKTFGFKLNLNYPKTFNEKLQWKKFYDHNPIYTLCSDKYAVREYIKKNIGEKYLIPLLFVTDEPDKIPFNKIKPPYVIKSNHGSSRNIFIYNEQEINKKKIVKECNNWLKENYYYYGKEWQYKNIKPKIIIEKLLLNKKNEIPKDYKFHCFNGKVEFIQVDTDRFTNHKRTIYDKTWKKLPFKYCAKVNNKPVYDEKIVKKPNNYDKLLKVAEKLSEDFNYVRVDLYLVNKKIFFGELTFTPGSGFECFFLNKYDLIYGEKIKLNRK